MANKWANFDFAFESKPKEPKIESKSKKKTTRTTRKQLQHLDNKPKSRRNFNFDKQVAPHQISELAVHPKKLKEVELWFKENVLEPNPTSSKRITPFLLITGPTGCAKTATIRVFCEEHSIDISEWINPVDQDFEFVRGAGQIARFTEFLIESKWTSLFATTNKKITLVKDFPNAVILNPEQLFPILEVCHNRSKSPIIFICTETNEPGMSMAQSLFPTEVRLKYAIAEIGFNACAISLVKNALRRAQGVANANADLFRPPAPATLDAIAASALGDVRSAVNQLYFASMRGAPELREEPVALSVQVGGKRKRAQPTSEFRCMQRDDSVGLFHGLGRVLNPKTVERHGRLEFQHDIGKLVHEFSGQPNVFISLLFENYLQYFGDVNDVFGAADVFVLVHELMEHSMDRYDLQSDALLICVLGIMLANKHKVSKWNPICGVNKAKRPISSFERKGFSSTEQFYVDIITGSKSTLFGK